MIQGRGKAAGKRFIGRSKRARCAILALLIGVLVVGSACDEEAAGRAFRDAAAGSLQSGVGSIMDGVVDGLFAMLEVGDDQPSDSSSSTTTGS
jgi:hypothetical protein